MAGLGFKNIGLKFVSLLIAAALWFAIAGQQVVERALRIPLEYTNMPAQLETSSDTPSVVDVRVRGSSAALSRLAPGELVAVLDVRGARPGRRLFHLSGGDVRAPFGIDVVQVNPANVAIVFAPSSLKTVPVVPAVEGEPADGYEVGTITADPATVEIEGPADALNRLTRAITEPVSVAGAKTNVRESVNIGVGDPALRLRKPQSARINVEVTAVPVERTVSSVALTVEGKRASSASAKPSRVTISVRGEHDAVSSLDASGVRAFVDVEGLAAGRYQLPVRVVAPERVAVVSVEPSHVQVNVH